MFNQHRHFQNKKARRHRLLEVLGTSATDETCDACTASLSDYIEAQLQGEDYLARFPNVALHLDSCVTCATAYASLYELEVADAAQTLPQPATVPAPDLSFLSGQTAVPPPTLKTWLQQSLARIEHGLQLQFTPHILTLLPPPAAAPTRAVTDSERYAEKLLVITPDEAPVPHWPVTLTAYRDAQAPHTCLVEVIVAPAGQSWPDLGGKKVTLRFDDQEETLLTDAWGLVSFSPVPVAALATMTVQIALL